MDDKLKHIKLHVGSMITLRALEHYLNDKNINCIIKNNTESARLSGYAGTGYIDELFVLEKDYISAKEILKTFLDE